MKNLMEYKGYFAKIEYNSDDDIFFGTVEGIVDSVSFEGANTNDLKQAFVEAVDDYLVMCERHHKEPQKYYKGSFNVRVSPEIHKRAAMIALSNGISLNQFVERAIENSLLSS
jgi:predicted HicB family RNase H-like nuclease